jgi:hypothetical protein
LVADLPEFGLRRADVDVIVLKTCQSEEREGGTARFKRALIGIGDSAPIRYR